MTDDLKGRVVLVTGGATGIGGAVSEAFGQAGARVVVHHHTGADAADAVVGRIRAGGGEATALQADLTVPAAPGSLVTRTVEAFGRLDILVNNAGGMVARRPIEAVDDDFIDAVIDLNVRSVIHCCRAAVPVMRAQGGGAIINVGSISARNGGSPGSSLYSGAKAFVSTFTRALARELAPDGIRVNAVAPGTIDTRFHEIHSTPEKLARTRGTIPLGRLGAPADCAGAFLWLASERQAGYVTGQVIEVNGGQLMP